MLNEELVAFLVPRFHERLTDPCQAAAGIGSRRDADLLVPCRPAAPGEMTVRRRRPAPAPRLYGAAVRRNLPPLGLPAMSGRPSGLAPLRQRGFRLLVGGQLVSNVGDTFSRGGAALVRARQPRRCAASRRRARRLRHPAHPSRRRRRPSQRPLASLAGDDGGRRRSCGRGGGPRGRGPQRGCERRLPHPHRGGDRRRRGVLPSGLVLDHPPASAGHRPPGGQRLLLGGDTAGDDDRSRHRGRPRRRVRAGGRFCRRRRLVRGLCGDARRHPVPQAARLRRQPTAAGPASGDSQTARARCRRDRGWDGAAGHVPAPAHRFRAGAAGDPARDAGGEPRLGRCERGGVAGAGAWAIRLRRRRLRRPDRILRRGRADWHARLGQTGGFRRPAIVASWGS